MKNDGNVWLGKKCKRNGNTDDNQQNRIPKFVFTSIRFKLQPMNISIVARSGPNICFPFLCVCVCVARLLILGELDVSTKKSHVIHAHTNKSHSRVCILFTVHLLFRSGRLHTKHYTICIYWSNANLYINHFDLFGCFQLISLVASSCCVFSYCSCKYFHSLLCFVQGDIMYGQ